MIEVNAEELERVARAHGVRRLRVFGSAVTDDFDPERSDIDLLVDLAPETKDKFDAYFGLKEDLERVFGRTVDLVMTDAVRNPYFRDRALASAEELYAA
ncbi:nucleotidyltransferase domain-containing protein [Microbacterium sp. KUDC0406]|uniref:nucleotidyltransferase family protein n=1 Tax=Microbacterium sp. KUDC0406 TaxID=2909588 RepID=UPI001F3F99D2|nr:nucleotidyltransferase domain-containing protein [Microbacterium sp. KUDC0406]UJP08940.1 nucleotidyltransferase domain-containing protein [Microbacterium sp. KUDC0406]